MIACLISHQDLMSEVTMRTKCCAGITGSVSIDANGDRNGDYSLLDMNKETGDFEVRKLQCNYRRLYRGEV